MAHHDTAESDTDVKKFHDDAQHVAGVGSVCPSRRLATILFLTFIYSLNYMDRQIVIILQEPIKSAFRLHDWQLGILTGGAFGLFYTMAGLPIAHRIDYGINRKRFIGFALATWSALTAICGISSNFVQFCIARMGVGLAEAGFAPAAHSLISDLYPARQRAQAMGLFAIGTPIGMMAGLSIGGIVAHHADWRTVLLLVGLPGIVVACLFPLIAREPARGASETRSPKQSGTEANVPFWQGFKLLMRDRAFFHLLVGTSLAVFVLAAVGSWLPSLLIRLYQMPLSKVGVSMGVLFGVCGILGTTIGGWQATRLGRRGGHMALVVPTVGLAVAVPLYFVALLAGKFEHVLLLLAIPTILGYLFVAPTIALFQTLAPVTMRARASATAVVTQNLVGTSLGPLAAGVLSDYFTARRSGDIGLGLRDALLVIVPILFWSVLHLAIAIRELRSREKRKPQPDMARS